MQRLRGGRIADPSRDLRTGAERPVRAYNRRHHVATVPRLGGLARMSSPHSRDLRRARSTLAHWHAATAGVIALGAIAIVWQWTLVPAAVLELMWLPVALAFLVASTAAVRRLDTRLSALDGEHAPRLEAIDTARAVALHDGLTGLGSHRAFQEALDEAVAAARRDETSLALLILDVDDLKKTNTAGGHAAGDELLRATARVILTALRRTDRAFRIGGDEFAVLLRDCPREDAVGLARRILADALSGGSGTLGVPGFSLTIGVSILPELARDRRQLVHQAEAALFWGKRHGRTDVQLFDASRNGIADDWRPLDELAAAVSRVARDRLLAPVFQPIHSLKTGQVLGFEGLVRPRPDAGFNDASSLFVAAESTDRTVELDLASLDAVLTAARRLDPSVYLSVNLSPRSLESDAFKPQELLNLARHRDIDPKRIVLELTEREAVEDFDRLRASLALLRRHGVRIAADDVGAGNAGLRLLRELEFDVMKVDLSLVQAGVVDDASGAVLRAIRELARQQHQMIVAEGVETSDQLVAVIELGFDAAQGYLLNRPGSSLRVEPVDLVHLAFPPAHEPARRPDGLTAPA